MNENIQYKMMDDCRTLHVIYEYEEKKCTIYKAEPFTEDDWLDFFFRWEPTDKDIDTAQ